MSAALSVLSQFGPRVMSQPPMHAPAATGAMPCDITLESPAVPALDALATVASQA